MPIYSYTAANRAGKTIRGKVSAANEIDLEEKIHDLGLILIGQKARKQRKSKVLGRIGVRNLIMFCVHMEQLIKAGVPLLDAIADLRDSADSTKFRDLMSEIFENVKSGDMLSAALAKRQDIFSEVFVGLVAAGEETGNLAKTFEHLGRHLKWTDQLRRSIKKAIRYPIALLLIMSGVITMMMTFVVPKLVNFLTSQGFDLPIHTRALIAMSDAFVGYWYLILGIPVFSVIVIIILYKTSEWFRYYMDGFFLKMPLIGSIILKINLSRFTRFFAVTFGSGIGILQCLNTAKNVVANRVIKESVQQIIRSVSEGNSLTNSIKQTNRFPSLVVRMFKVGEDSGNMENALENINFFYDKEVDDGVAVLVGSLQPILTVIMGLIMLWIISAVFGPLYQSFKNIQ